MKTVEAILATHDIVGGNRAVVKRNKGGSLRLAGMHNHLGVDAVDRDPRRSIDKAAAAGIDVLIPTDHDKQMLWEVYAPLIVASGMRAIAGMEVTALRRDGKGLGPGHVLVYGVDNPPPEIMPVKDLNVWAHEQGGYTAVAHPTMGHESLSLAQIRAVQTGQKEEAFDLVEVHNYGDDQLQRYGKLAWPLPQLSAAMGLAPRPGANEEAHKIAVEFQGHKNKLQPIGGSDSHRSKDVDGVLVGFENDLLGEALRGEVVIFRKKRITVPSPLQLLRLHSLDQLEQRRWREQLEKQLTRQEASGDSVAV